MISTENINEQYPSPPITEALLDIRVSLPPDVTLEQLSTYYEGIKDSFPEKEQRVSWTGGFEFKPGSAPKVTTPSGGPDGYFFRSPSDNKIVQVRRDGFTFNKLKPYTNWDTFSKEAKSHWNQYLQIAKPYQITRLALRYINRIEIPLPFKDFKEYILTIPDIAPGLPNAMSNMIMQLVVPNDEIGAVANITETIEPIKEGQSFSAFIFDIDVYRKVALKPDDKKIWDIIEDLRVFKNQIFKKSLTDKCKELFK